jgi:hypothetical protein
MSAFLAKREARQKKIEERIKKGGKGKVTEAPKPQGVATRKVWKWEVEDFSKIRREFLTTDNSAIKAVVDAQGAEAVESVGGIKVWQESQIAASRGT